MRALKAAAGLFLCAAFAAAPMSALAATATFVTPTSMTATDQTALSAQGDSAGFLVGRNQTLGILLDTAIGVTSGGSVSVFTLSPELGRAHARIRVGNYNGGSPVFATSRNVRAGRNRTFNNVFHRGCGLLGGCDYIEIITNRTRRGAAGVEVDYVVVDGEVVMVTGPTPEPSTWVLMIIGFVAVAWRLKHLRRGGALSPLPNGVAGASA